MSDPAHPQRFEHHVDRHFSSGNLEKSLKKLEKDGWELVTATNSGNLYITIWKRPV
jgi:DNA-binding PadR family transcriptional regulator